MIQDVMEGEKSQAYREQHLARVDLLVKNSDRALIIIVMQADRQDDYLHRILYGVSECVADNILQGVSYEQNGRGHREGREEATARQSHQLIMWENARGCH